MDKIAKIALAVFFVCALMNSAYAQDNGTEFFVEDDFLVRGYEGSIADPDVEIVGYTVFGTTTSAIMYAEGAGDVAIGGDLQVDGTSYFVGHSSFTFGPASIFVQGGANEQLLTYNGATGAMVWTDANVLGDDMGTQVATTHLNMMSYDIINVSSISFLSGVEISSASAAQYGGIFISTHMYIANNTYIAGALDVAGNVILGDKIVDTVDVIGILNVDASLTVDGNAQLGDVATDDHGINIAVEDGIALKIQGDTGAGATALEVVGGGASGDYISKYYSGASLVGGFRKK